MYLFRRSKDIKMLVSQVNAHQNVTLREEEFNNQVDRVTHSVDGEPLSPGIVIAQWAHGQSGHWSKLIFPLQGECHLETAS